MPLTRIPYFKGDIKSKAKFHITIGHETVMANITAFKGTAGAAFDMAQEFEYLDQVLSPGMETSELWSKSS